MESNGAVFLPLTGWRNGQEFVRAHKNGTYWSRTSYDTESAFELNMQEKYDSDDKEYHYSHHADKRLDKYYGVGVRLVRKIK